MVLYDKIYNKISFFQFARNPSKFSVRSQTEQHKSSSLTNESYQSEGNTPHEGEGCQNISIVYEFPWGSESVEDVNNKGELTLKHLQDTTGLECKVKFAFIITEKRLSRHFVKYLIE